MVLAATRSTLERVRSMRQANSRGFFVLQGDEEIGFVDLGEPKAAPRSCRNCGGPTAGGRRCDWCGGAPS